MRAEPRQDLGSAPGCRPTPLEELKAQAQRLRDEIGRPCYDPSCSYCPALHALEKELYELGAMNARQVAQRRRALREGTARVSGGGR